MTDGPTLRHTETYRRHGGPPRGKTQIRHGAARVSSPAEGGFNGAVAVCLTTSERKKHTHMTDRYRHDHTDRSWQ